MFLTAIVCIVLSGAAGSAPVAPPSPVEVASIDIKPEAMTIGQQPSIIARIARMKTEFPQDPAYFSVIAVVTLPDKVTRSWTVQNVPIRPGESKDFLLPRIFETKLAGEYRIEYSIYSDDMRRRYTSRAKTFTAGLAAP
jgi:hypothetical protein